MAQAAEEDEDVEYLMKAEPARERIRLLEPVDHCPDRVEDSPDKEPTENVKAYCTDQRACSKDNKPAHCQVYAGIQPPRSVEIKYLEEHAGNSQSPDYRQYDIARSATQRTETDRSVCAGYENEDHYVIELAQYKFHTGRDIEQMICSAGGVKQYQAGAEY